MADLRGQGTHKIQSEKEPKENRQIVKMLPPTAIAGTGNNPSSRW